MTELICVVCALKADASASAGIFQFDDSNPLAARTCPTCNSSATVGVDIFKRFAAARATQDKSKPLGPSGPAKVVDYSPGEASPLRARDVVDKHVAETSSKILNESHKWAAHVAALRKFFRRSTVLNVADAWWDGYHFYNITSWSAGLSNDILERHLDFVAIRLINKNSEYRDVMFYIDIDDEGLTEIGDVQRS